MLTHPITVPERVFLKGCGIRKSKIIWFPYHWDTDELPDYMILLQGNAEVSGLDISGTRLGPLFVTRGKDNHNIYIHDCRVFLTPYNGSPTNAHPRGNGLEDYQAYGLVRRELDYWQRENGHITFKMEGVDNLRLYDNDIYIDMDSCGFRLSHCNNAYVARNRNNACLRTHGSQNVLIEECEATRTAIEGDNIYFAHNDLHDSNLNNREIMTTDGGGFLEHSEQYYIRATASEYEYELPFPFGKDVLVHAQLLILEGPGEGQMRRIVANDGLGITLDSPFAVAPVDKESKMYILTARSNVIAAHNHLYNAGDFQFYGTQLNSIVTHNEFEKVRGFVATARPLYGSTMPNWYISLTENRFWDANFLHHNGWAPQPTKPMSKIDINAGGTRRNMQLCPLVRGNDLEDGFYMTFASGTASGNVVGLTVQRNQVSEAEQAIVCRTNAQCEGILFADNRIEDSEEDYVLPEEDEFLESAPGTDSPKYIFMK